MGARRDEFLLLLNGVAVFETRFESSQRKDSEPKTWTCFGYVKEL